MEAFCLQTQTWCPDPGALYVDAFLVDWKDLQFYAFPHFSLINCCIQKIQEDEVEGILVVPNWATQPWNHQHKRMRIRSPLLLPQENNLLTLSMTLHTLQKKLRFRACLLSGSPSKTEGFLNLLPMASCHPGDQSPKHSTTHMSGAGICSEVRGRPIQFHHL